MSMSSWLRETPVKTSMLHPPMIHHGRSKPSMNSAMVVGSSGSHPPYQRLNSSSGRWPAAGGCAAGGGVGGDTRRDATAEQPRLSGVTQPGIDHRLAGSTFRTSYAADGERRGHADERKHLDGAARFRQAPGMGCVFCQILETGEARWVAQREDAVAFLPLPEGEIAPGHTLVIPREHAVGVQDASAQALAATTALLQEVSRAMTRAIGAPRCCGLERQWPPLRTER